jgi:replicative DNA helicase
MKRMAGAIDKGLAEPEAEKAVLCLIVSSAGEALTDPEICADLFFTPPHLTIFWACKTLFDKGVKVEFRALTQLLEDKDQLAGVGGPAAISGLQFNEPGTPSHFMGILKRAHAKRKLRLLIQDAEVAMMEGAEVEELITTMSARIAELDPSAVVEDQLEKSFEEAMFRIKQIESGVKRPGVPTGLDCWDYTLGGIVPGMYIGLAARPGKGKSAMMEQVATKLLRDDLPVCIFSQDMAPNQVLMRMACRIAGVSKFKLDQGNVDKQETEEVKEALEALRKSKLRLHSLPRLSGEQLVAIARRDARRFGCKSFWLDHIQTLAVPKGKEPRIAFGEASKLIRAFTTSERVSFVTLAHLNREAAKGANVNQVKEFDDMLGDVDGLILLDSVQDPAKLRDYDDWIMRFKVGKNRNGPEIEPDVIFWRETMEFRNISRSMDIKHK